MKRYFVVLAAITLFIAMASGAWAAGTTSSGNIGVTGTVANVCEITNTATALDWPSINLDPTNAIAAHAAAVSGTLTAECTKNYAFTVLAASANVGAPAADCSTGIAGSLTTGGGGANKVISYTFTCTPASATGQGFGVANAVDLAPSATIDETNATNQVAIAGSYTDTLTVTINY